MAKSNTKRHATAQQNKLVLLLLGLVLLGVAYGAASWAIDSGRWSMYAATFVSLYFGVRFIHRAARLFFSEK